MIRVLLFLVLSVSLLAACGGAQQAAVCEARTFEGDQFTVCAYDSRRHELRLTWQSAEGEAYRGFTRLSQDVVADEIAFATNAGMFNDKGAPIGLYVEHGQELHAISTTDGPGNFHLKPNGVFWVDVAGDPHVSATDDFIADKSDPLWATQSGPMLVIGGQLHPEFQPDGNSRHVRNGVGVSDKRSAVFVISEQPVSFGKLARFFRDALQCPDALYLDGTVSGLWAPSLGRMDKGFPLGPLVVVRYP